MHRKFLQQSLAIQEDSLSKKFEVEYYLIESENHDLVINECSDEKTYGMEIIKK
jgi:hypothetical protein